MKKNEVRIGAILSYIVIGLNMVVGILYTPYLTKMLGQSEYGLYSIVVSIIGYLTVLDLGFGNAIIIYTSKYIAKKDKEKEKKLHGMFLIIYTIIGILAGIIGVVLYFNVDNMFGQSMTYEEVKTAKTLMGILTLNLVITFPLSIFSSIITAYEKFVFNKLVNIIRIILMPLIMIPLLTMGYKSIALVILSTVLNIGSLLINAIYCLVKLPIKFSFKKFDFRALREIFSYSFYIFLNTIIDKISWNVDTFILGTISGTISVAIYGVAAQFNNMYLSFSTAISSVLLPRVSKMEENHCSDKEFSDVFIRTGRIQYLVMALIITGFVIFGRVFIQLLFGMDYNQSYLIACILMIPVTVPLIQNTGLNIIQAKNKHKFRTIVFLFIAIGNVFISIPLAKYFQGIGAAIGTAIALCIGQIIIMNLYYYKKIHINIPKFWKEIAKMTRPIIIILIVGFLGSYYIRVTNIVVLLLEMGIYAGIYVIGMWHFAMNQEERELFAKPIRTLKNRFKGGKQNDTNKI